MVPPARTPLPSSSKADRSPSANSIGDRVKWPQALRAVGVRPGDRVAFIDKNGLEWFEVIFGLAKLGAVNVSVNWRLAPAEMAQIINDAQAEVVIVGPEFVSHIKKIEAELPGVRRIVAIGGHDRWPYYEDWVDAHDGRDPGVTSGGDDVAFQLYTSGTTGLPKGVMLTNDNFFRARRRRGAVASSTPESVNLAVMPMFHIAGSGWAHGGAVPRLPNRAAPRRRPGRDPASDPRVRRHQRVHRPRGHPVPAVDARASTRPTSRPCRASSTARRRSPTRCS